MFKRAKVAFFLFVASICVLTRNPASACTDGKGDPIKSTFMVPYFEKSPVEIDSARDLAINNAEETLGAILALNSTDLTFDNTLGALDQLLFNFYSDYARLNLLRYTSDDEKLRKVASEAVVTMGKWSLEKIGLNFELYQVIAAYEMTDEATELMGEHLRLLEETIAGYERQGMALNETNRELLVTLQNRLTELTSNISTNINNAEGVVEYTLDELDGLDEKQLEGLEYQPDRDRYIVKTAISSDYRMILGYATNANTRLRAMRARYQRAMNENSNMILEVIQNRQKTSALLGFNNWADFRIASRMAGSGKTAYDFIRNLSERLDEPFQIEQEIILELKQEHLNNSDLIIDDLNREDIRLYTNRLMERDYQVDHQAISEYFEEQATLRGIFDIYEDLFGLNITVMDVPEENSWADEIQMALISEQGGDGDVIGGVYLDLHPRSGKYKHFAQFGIIDGHLRQDGLYQAPLCAIVGNWPQAPNNFTKPLWTFDQVSTMLHEFGHALHTILTCAELSSFAGTSVPRDFVEVPSQALERWLEDINVVRRFAKHHETGETLPDYLLEGLTNAKYATIGHWYKRQVSWGLSDLRIHSYSSASEIPLTPSAVYNATNEDYATYYAVPEDSAPLANFGHLFGGYDAGYYGYAWADAIAADLASLFRNSTDGFMDRKLGALFRKEILEPGNSRDVADSIRAFLGRDWNTDAFFMELLYS